MARDNDSLSFGDLLKALGFVAAILSFFHFRKESEKEEAKLEKSFFQKPGQAETSAGLLKDEYLKTESGWMRQLLKWFGGLSPFWGASASMIPVGIATMLLVIITASFAGALMGTRTRESLNAVTDTFSGLWWIINIILFVYVYSRFRPYRKYIEEKLSPEGILNLKQFAAEQSGDTADTDNFFFKRTDNELVNKGEGISLGKKMIIPNTERNRHMYVIGMTGAGKSRAALSWFLQDVVAGKGCALLDPHGDLADGCLSMLANNLYSKDTEVNKRTDLTLEEIEKRIKDNPLLKRLKIIDPTNPGYAVGFNPVEKIVGVDSYRQAKQLESVFKKVWKFEENEAPNMSQILRHTAYVLIENEQTLLEATLLLTNTRFRERMLRKITHPEVLLFWRERFEKWISEHQTSKIDSTYNKIEAFTSDPLIRPIIGQKKSTIRFRESMDKGDVLIIKLPKGAMETSANLLGGFFITSMHLSAVTREDIPTEERRPFYVYADEFQNFASANFDEILSEDRKYGLHYILINQYLSKIDEEIMDSIFGNVNLFVVFRIGNLEDAEIIGAHIFRPTGQVVKDVQKELQSIPGTMIAYQKNRYEKYRFDEELMVKARELMELPDRVFAVYHRGLSAPYIDYSMTIHQPDSDKGLVRSYIKKVKEIVDRRNARKKDDINKETEERIKEYLHRIPEHDRPEQKNILPHQTSVKTHTAKNG